MAMDFFERQEAARRKTGLLVLYFVLAVLAVTAAIYLVFDGVYYYMRLQGAYSGRGSGRPPGFLWWNPALAFWVSVATLAVISIGSLYKTLVLARGGDAVAQLLGGRKVAPDTDDLDERRLLNVVEEMAIASGTPVPAVYVLDRELGINAFAAGLTPNRAVVAVTHGTLELLSRDELQGVIAHEFSHILNGDMRLNVRLIGILHGILLIALIGYVLLRTSGGRVYFSRQRGSGRGVALLIGLALVVIGYVGVFFGRLIKSAVSRQREFLADASAVQFTRNPDGIAGALKKIGGLIYGSRIANSHAEEASHLFFGSGVKSWFALLSTHPPLEVRIKRIDPSFDGRFPRVELPARRAREATRRRRVRVPQFAGVPPALEGIRGLTEAGHVPLGPAEMVGWVGAPSTEHLDYAAALLEALPDALHDAAGSPFGARAIIYALLLDVNKAVRNEQQTCLARRADKTVYAETRKLSPLVDGLKSEFRLPLVELTFPALRSLSPEQYRTFRGVVDELIQADHRIDLFEYVVGRMLMRHLDDHFTERRPPIVQYYALRALRPECAVLLSTLAWVGHRSADEVRRAFAAGAALLPMGREPLQMLERSRCSLEAVDSALDKLVQASPAIKKHLLAACSACVATDGKVTVREGELLRAIADSLDCPMPPLLPDVES